MITDTIKEKYKELISYISQMGNRTQIKYESQVETSLQIFNYFGDEIINIHLFQPLDDSKEYNYRRLRVSWKVPPEGTLGHNAWYNENTNQDIIFKRLLFDILNWRIQNIDKKSIDSSNMIIYEVIKNWSITEMKKHQRFCLKEIFKAKVKKILSIFHVSKNNKYTE